MADNIQISLPTNGEIFKKHPELVDCMREVERILINQSSNNSTKTTDITTNEDSIALNTTHRGLTSGNPHSVSKSDVSLGNVANVLCKFDATAAPTVNNDVDEGYSVGSTWFDETNNKAYACLDASDGAADWNQIDGAAGGASFNTMFIASMSGNTALVSTVTKKVDFDTVDYDLGSDWDAGNGRFKCPADGKYLCIPHVEIGASASGHRIIYIYVNGANAGARTSPNMSGSFTARFGDAKVLTLEEDDYVEVYAYQNSGGGLNVVSGFDSYLQIFGSLG